MSLIGCPLCQPGAVCATQSLIEPPFEAGLHLQRISRASRVPVARRLGALVAPVGLSARGSFPRSPHPASPGHITQCWRNSGRCCDFDRNPGRLKLVIPAKAQGCPGKFQGCRFVALASPLQQKNPLARACPGHPRLCRSKLRGGRRRGWPGQARPRGIYGCYENPQHNRFPFPGQPCAEAGVTGWNASIKRR
jgi:hypothetical protein